MDQGSKFNQFIAAFAASMSAITVGACVSWIDYEEHRTGLPEGGRFNPQFILFFFVTAVAAFVSMFLINFRGPLLVLRLGALLTLVIWIICALLFEFQNPFLTTIYLFALISGFNTAPISLYIGEIAQKEVRGAFASLVSLNIKLGIFMADLTLELHEDYALSYVCIAISVVQILFLFQIYEAPLFLVLNDYKDDAGDALDWLYGRQLDINAEIERLENVILSMQNGGLLNTFGICFKARRAWLIVVVIIIFYQFTGVALAVYVSTFVYKKVGVTTHVVSLVDGIVQISATITSMYLVDKIGRRLILSISSVGISFAAFALGACLSSQFFGWLPLVALLLYLIMFSFGYGPVLWILIAELFPVNGKVLACPLAVVVFWLSRILIALIIQIFMYMQVVETDYRFGLVFFVFGVVTLLGLVFALCAVPETKQKTFSEIQDILE